MKIVSLSRVQSNEIKELNAGHERCEDKTAFEILHRLVKQIPSGRRPLYNTILETEAEITMEFT